jgi:pimeloyl-ACP methyl ester carboxylesterase
VLVAGFFYSDPEMTSGVVDDLATDHTVLTYDLRGTGASSPEGPYDLATDVTDLTAVLEAAGGAAVAVGLGDGGNRAVRVAADRPDLLGSVVLSGAPAYGGAAQDVDALSGSPSVLRGLRQMLRTDYRGALRSFLPQERVELVVDHCPPEAAAGRFESWIHDDPSAEARALGDRLWILHFPGNMWFPDELAETNRQMLPQAHLVAVEDGAINRPDLTAAVVRRLAADGG